jgi:hypothetical protein
MTTSTDAGLPHFLQEQGVAHAGFQHAPPASKQEALLWRSHRKAASAGPAGTGAARTAHYYIYIYILSTWHLLVPNSMHARAVCRLKPHCKLTPAPKSANIWVAAAAAAAAAAVCMHACIWSLVIFEWGQPGVPQPWHLLYTHPHLGEVLTVTLVNQQPGASCRLLLLREVLAPNTSFLAAAPRPYVATKPNTHPAAGSFAVLLEGGVYATSSPDSGPAVAAVRV